jgi:hypothetical protein
MKKPVLAILVILLLSACSPQAAETKTLRIAVSPAAQPVSEAIAYCVPTDTGSSIEMRYPHTIELSEVDLLIQLGEPTNETGFAAQLAWEEVVLVVNPGNQANISRDRAASLFSGRVQNWTELGGNDATVSLWAGPEGDEARSSFETGVLLHSVSGGTHIATNPAAAMEVVANDPAATAIVAAAWTDETVKSIDLGLQMPVIAVAAEDPSGAVRDLLACLQGPVGQAAISEHYIPFQR